MLAILSEYVRAICKVNFSHKLRYTFHNYLFIKLLPLVPEKALPGVPAHGKQ
jgi:hypothetical protein